MARMSRMSLIRQLFLWLVVKSAFASIELLKTFCPAVNQDLQYRINQDLQYRITQNLLSRITQNLLSRINQDLQYRSHKLSALGYLFEQSSGNAPDSFQTRSFSVMAGS
jgi:hypothetical protein